MTSITSLAIINLSQAKEILSQAKENLSQAKEILSQAKEILALAFTKLALLLYVISLIKYFFAESGEFQGEKEGKKVRESSLTFSKACPIKFQRGG